jgi:lysophospholipase L1-like esterase
LPPQGTRVSFPKVVFNPWDVELAMLNKMLRLTLVAALLGFGGLSSQSIAQESAPASQPAKQDATEARLQDALARRGAHYEKRLRAFIAETPKEEKYGVVFVGDSLTEGFPLKEAFPDQNVINRGISGDKIKGVTERLDVSVKDLEPKKVYLLIGTNEFVWSDREPPETMKAEYIELLDGIKKAAPAAELYVASVPPVGPGYGWAAPRVVTVNTMLKELALQRDFQWVNIHDRLVGDDGFLRADYTSDGIHFTLKGYLAWLETILTPSEFVDAALALEKRWDIYHGYTHDADKVNPATQAGFPGGRGENELVVFTNAYGQERTGTNQWGSEAVVVEGVVTQSGGNDNVIPSNGMVISGHGSAANWIAFNLTPGTRVQFDGMKVSFDRKPETELKPQQLLEVMRDELLNALMAFRQKEDADALQKETRAMVEEIVTMMKQGNVPPQQRLQQLSARRSELVKLADK